MKQHSFQLAHNIHQRLEQLNLDEQSLIEAVKHGYLVRSSLTPNHPRIFFGYATWAETVARLRDILAPKGWQRLEKGNSELVINEFQDVAIAVAAGDEFTGQTHATPSNRCPKGTNTIDAINTNNQLDLFAELIPLPPTSNNSFTTWILLHYSADNEIRCELSLPSSIGTDGRIKDWKERIILKHIPLDQITIDVLPLESQDIEIEIRRKA